MGLLRHGDDLRPRGFRTDEDTDPRRDLCLYLECCRRDRAHDRTSLLGLEETQE